MGHNSVVLGHPKSTGILWIDGLSMGLSDLRRHSSRSRVLKNLSCFHIWHWKWVFPIADLQYQHI